MDWLYSLANCNVETLNGDVSISGTMHYYGGDIIVPVLWNRDVYVIDSPYTTKKEGKQCKLLKYSTSADTWNDYIICAEGGHWPKSQVHVLTTYNSRLLLFNASDRKAWQFDTYDSTFKPSSDIVLPQSWEATDSCVTAASEGEYLIISGRSCPKDLVYIYDGESWIVRDSPFFYNILNLQVNVHNRSIFLSETNTETEKDWTRWGWSSLHYSDDTKIVKHTFCVTSLQSLIDNDPNAWPRLNWTTLSMHHHEDAAFSNYITVGRHLVIFSYIYGKFSSWYCPLDSRSWISTGYTQLPQPVFHVDTLCVVRLHDGSLMIICSSSYSRCTAVYRLKPNGECCFTVHME